LTICPCCGFKFEGDLRAGCAGCGARSVGEPLARPQYELPAFGRALLVSVIGAATLLLFLIVMIIAWVGQTSSSFDFSSISAAAESAAWRLKWLGFPLAIASVWLSWRVYGSIRNQPLRFMGTRAARGGVAASVLFALLMTTMVGITVPERLRQRQRGIEAAYRARLYAHNRAFLEYRARFGTYPVDLNELRNLPDDDGSIAELLTQEEATSYKPWTELAATQPAPGKSRRLRGAAIQPASLTAGTDDSTGEGVPFTNYELRLPGEDKILGTEDDWLIRDGMVLPATDLETRMSVVPTGTNAP
jgi:hypothetical protein